MEIKSVLIALILITSCNAKAQFETLTSGNDPEPRMSTEESGDASFRNPVPSPANMSPVEAINKVAESQTELLKKTDAVHDQMQDLPVKMTENFDKTMDQLKMINDRFGTLGILINFVSSYGIYLIAFCAILPLTIIFLQALILCQSCRSRGSVQTCHHRNVELDSIG